MTRYVMGQVQEKLRWTCGLHYGTAFAAEFVLSPLYDSNNWYFTEDIYRK